jgi:hypothetical protein
LCFAASVVKDDKKERDQLAIQYKHYFGHPSLHDGADYTGPATAGDDRCIARVVEEYNVSCLVFVDGRSGEPPVGFSYHTDVSLNNGKPPVVLMLRDEHYTLLVPVP